MSYERKRKVKNTWWVKIWADDVLNGSMMAEGTLEDLGFMTAMVCLATKCRGDYGWIQANPECAFSHQWIANRITGGDLPKFEELLKKMIKEERLSETEGKGIFVCNMEYYQLEKGTKGSGDNGSKPDKMPLTTEEAITRQKQLAADMAYKFPDDAQVGRERKLSEREFKNRRTINND